jgi:dissimilatory sulfite reductase related protein
MSTLENVERNEEGFLVNPADWTKEMAGEIAQQEGITELTADHWKIIEFSRANAEASGAAPTLRQITKGAGVPTKQLFKLFPKGPAKKVAKVSGLGKPEGCV